ncbi:protein FAM210A [Aphidius gifuensis]|uniref:protein FAM210A n=1 Tax=Aphidius gifuensis TaxID=684658 RepID=UPI001CDC2A0A|nr:protein FAM210A [Aphidius gifuensis]XP_044005605.1 protein FAM210A [Aphidius gifuensis]
MELIMRRNTAGVLLKTIGHSGYLNSLRNSGYLCELNLTKWTKKRNDSSILKKNNSIFSCPISSSNFCSLFEKSLVHDLSDRRIIVSHYSTESDNDKSKVCNTTQPKKKISIFQKMKQLYRDYWKILIPVHIVTSVFHGEKYIQLMKNSNAGDFAVTYALYKVFTPLRYTVTVGGTTLAIKSIEKLGYQHLIRPSIKTTTSSSESSSSHKETPSSSTSTKCLTEDRESKN